MTHRRDIDGLRGVAVLLVIAYHAQIPPFTSGYVGVDVFLVISGFVITQLLLEQASANRFRFSAFLARRARRLIPAMVVTTAATLAAALVVMGPSDLTLLARSALATLALGSNIFFWIHQGYFEDQVPEQPLLHTWSLGLEGQFYLLFPTLLIPLARASPRMRVILLGAGAVASFVLGAWMTGRHPGAAFYLPPGRAWEFLLGGVIAVLPQRASQPSLYREVMAAVGLTCTVLAAATLSKTTPYPGVAALLPAAATAAVIWADASGTTRTGRVLSNRAIAFTGLISYSLYLWHWPAFALARYYVARPLRPLETAAALLFVFGLAYLSWRYLEQTFRVTGKSVQPQRFSSPIVALAAVVAVGATITSAQQGFPARLPDSALALDRSRDLRAVKGRDCHRGPPDVVREDQLCKISAPQRARDKILLWGDSHANAIAGQMRKLGELEQFEVWQASYSSCPPIIGAAVAHMGASHHCREFNETVLKAIPHLGIRRVVLAAFWSGYLPASSDSYLARALDPYGAPSDLRTGDGPRDFHNLADGIQQTVARLEALGIEVWILKPVPVQNGFVPMMLARAAVRGDDLSRIGISLAEHRRSQERVDNILSQVRDVAGLLDPAVALCSSGWCPASDGVDSFYCDSNHLTPRGAEQLEPQLRSIFH